MSIITRRNRRTTAFAVLATTAAWLVVVPSAAASPLVNLSDTFTRTVAAGWGTASPTGGDWKESTNGISGTAGFSTNGSRGIIATPSTGDSRLARQIGFTTRDVDATFDVSVGSLPVGGWVKVFFIGRSDDADSLKNYNQYRLYVKISPKTTGHTEGDIAVGINKQLSSGGTTLAGETTECTNCLDATETLHVHVQIQRDLDDTTFSHLRIRQWTGATEPSTWDLDTTDGDAALTGAGWTGVRVATGTGVSNVPFNVRFDNLVFENIKPPTTPTVSGGSLTWTNGTGRTISASGSTDSGGAAADHYQYRTTTDGQTWTSPATGTAANITAEGQTYVQFRAVDTLGNYSPWSPDIPGAAATALIDRTPPTAPTVHGGSSTAQHGPVAIAASDSWDALEAGAVTFLYRLSTDGGTTWSSASTAADGVVQLTADADTLVQFAAKDGAGNQSAWVPDPSDGSNEANIDTALPLPTGTTVSAFSHITTNTTWTATNSPYILGDGQVFVDSGVTLTINPGVTVIGTTIHSQLVINGSVSAVGTGTSPIVFTSQDGYDGGGGLTGGSPGDWLGIQFNGSGTSDLEHALVSYGGNGAADSSSGNIAVTKGTVTIAHVNSIYSATSAMLVAGSVVSPPYPEADVVDSHFDFSHTGIYVSSAIAHVDTSTAYFDASRGVQFVLANIPSLEASTFDNGIVWGSSSYAVYINPSADLDTASWPTGTGSILNAATSPILQIEHYDPVGGAWTGNTWPGGGIVFPCTADADSWDYVVETAVSALSDFLGKPIPPEQEPFAWTATPYETHIILGPPVVTCKAAKADSVPA